jgi:esterase/lipase superfamily enzyme
MDDRLRSKIHTIDGAASFYSFTNAGALSYGIANVTIPRIHKKGKLEDRGILEFRHNPATHVILQNLRLKNSEEFFTELSEMFKAREAAFPDSTQAKELFVYIHGFNVDFSYAMRKTAQLMYDMDYPGLSIAFSWPARAVSVPLPSDFRDDVTRGEASAPVLELFLNQIIEKYPDRKIHIVAHSLGARVLSQVLINITKSLNGDRMKEGVKKVFGEVILAAPAMDAETFVTSLASRMTPLCDRVSIYASDDDYALKVQHLAEGPNFSFPLGLWDNKANKRGISDGVTHYDLSSLSAGTFSLDHSTYSEVPVALDHMKLILNHRPTDVDLGTLGYVRKTNGLDFFSRKAKEFWQFLEI